jgi:hypothetical protein
MSTIGERMDCKTVGHRLVSPAASSWADSWVRKAVTWAPSCLRA